MGSLSADDRAAYALGTVHEDLSGLVASMMGAATGRSAPAPHVSFFVIGGRQPQAVELVTMLNAVFNLDLRDDAVVRSPTPDSLARTIAAAWFEADGSVEDLVDRLAVIGDAD
jgi:hypothetical protein